MPRFLTRFLTGFIGAVILAGIVFGRVGSRGHPHLFDVLTPEKFPPFALQVLAVGAFAGIGWACIDTWTHPSPKPKPGDGILWYALSRLVIGFFGAAFFTMCFIGRGQSVEALRAYLAPEGFLPRAVPVIVVSLLAAFVWTISGVLSFNSGERGANNPLQ